MSGQRSKISLAIIAAALSTQAFAQQLEEVVVTAQKRSQSIQDVPISISAFTASELEKAGISTYDDLGLVTPGLQSSRQVGASAPFLRGVGVQATSVGLESPVAIYLDGVYVSGTVDGIMQLNNIERMEVLKGPQGTLFGRNTTGGIIHIITADPTHDTQLDLGVSAGNYETYGGKFFGNVSLSDTVAVNLAMTAQRQDDYFGENTFTGNDVGYEEYTNVRSKLLWEPSDKTAVKLSARWSERHDDIGVVRGCAKTATYGCAAGLQPHDDINDETANIDGESKADTWATALTISHRFDSFDFLSITSFKNTDSSQEFDQESGPVAAIKAVLNQDDDTFTQEFQISSNDDSKPYTWIAGLYYYYDDWKYDPLFLEGLAVQFQITPPLFGVPLSVLEIYSGVETESYAAFAEGTWNFTDATRLTLGARYTKDDRKNSGRSDYFNPGEPIYASLSFDTDKTWDDPTYRAVLQHDLTDNVMTYVSYNRGFKSGSFNTVNTFGYAYDPVEPETVDAYEIGMKGDFFDNTFRANLAAFYYDYSDIQLQKIDNGISLLQNAAGGEIYGLDAEAQAALTDNLTLRLGLSLLDTEYTDFPGCQINTPDPSASPFGAGNITTVGDCSGNELIRSPKYTYNIGGVYNLPTSTGIYGLALTVAYNDGFYWEPDNRAKEDSYTVVNAEASWTSVNEKYKLTLWGKNLADEEFSAYTTEAVFGDTWAGAPPLTWGVTAEMFMF